jgi:hypothetical protein
MASIGLGIATPIPDQTAASQPAPFLTQSSANALRLPLRQAGVRPKSSEKAVHSEPQALRP